MDVWGEKSSDWVLNIDVLSWGEGAAPGASILG